MQNEVTRECGNIKERFHIYLININIKVQMKINATIISEHRNKNVNREKTPNFAAKKSFTIKRGVNKK